LAVQSTLRKYVIVVGLLGIVGVSSANGQNRIIVKGGSVQQTVVLVDAELSGKPVQLECFVSDSDCKIPGRGAYVLIKMPTGKGPYMDCPNVSLYKKGGATAPTGKVADYCLLDHVTEQ
jgi:hypothetical protein